MPARQGLVRRRWPPIHDAFRSPSLHGARWRGDGFGRTARCADLQDTSAGRRSPAPAVGLVGLEPTTNGSRERSPLCAATVVSAHADLRAGDAACAAYSRASLAVSFAVIKSIVRRPRALVNHDGDRAAPRRSRVAARRRHAPYASAVCLRMCPLPRPARSPVSRSGGPGPCVPRRRGWWRRVSGELILHRSTVEAIDLRERWAPWDSDPQPTD
jgi:hypothetical protein